MAYSLGRIARKFHRRYKLLNIKSENPIRQFVSQAARYATTLSALVVYLPIVLYPAFVALQNPPPQQTELTYLSVKILSAQRFSPNFTLRRIDGTGVEANFPADLYFSSALHPSHFSGMTKSDLAKMVGCNASVGVKAIAWSYPSRLSVWDVQSSCGQYSYAQAKAYFNKNCEFGMLEFFYEISFIALFMLTMYGDRRLNKREKIRSRSKLD